MTKLGTSKTPEKVVRLLKGAVVTKSQSQIARESGIAVSIINRYLNGVGTPTLENLQKLADYFGESFTITVEPRQTGDRA